MKGHEKSGWIYYFSVIYMEHVYILPPRQDHLI